jgi:predicted nicotinamide N-methyase
MKGFSRMTESDIGRLTTILQGTLPDAKVEKKQLDLCPEISLYLISPDKMSRAFSPEEVRSILNKTPYWAFCWAAGHALAAFLLKHSEVCKGRYVLDFGAGSGVAGIAAALAGAREVVACDSDEEALEAVTANAQLNRVRILTCNSMDEVPWRPDIIFASDVFYDRDNLPLLERLPEMAHTVLVADARVKITVEPTYKMVFEMDAETLPDLKEAEDFRHVGFYMAGDRPGGF